MALEQFMKDQEIAKAYKNIQPETNVIRAIVKARASQNLSKKNLSRGPALPKQESVK